MSELSRVLDTPPAPPAESAKFMHDKLRFHTDAWDLAADLVAGHEDLVVIDTRSGSHYRAGHIPGAISLPHVEMTTERLMSLDRHRVYVTYCDGIGCNGSTHGAFKLASAGLRVKELLGGLDFWRRDGHLVVEGPEPGTLVGQTLIHCGC